ncbi:hypothetical protein BGLA2_1080017 [Burkholderia gladioli]|nr:hypothetical protein BGLA2_1080017 [Burkholderia gladioli]
MAVCKTFCRSKSSSIVRSSLISSSTLRITGCRYNVGISLCKLALPTPRYQFPLYEASLWRTRVASSSSSILAAYFAIESTSIFRCATILWPLSASYFLNQYQEEILRPDMQLCVPKPAEQRCQFALYSLSPHEETQNRQETSAILRILALSNAEEVNNETALAT